MEFQKLPVNRKATQLNLEIERLGNRIVRSYDDVLGRLHLGGRAAQYDDVHYEFIGGSGDTLRKKHYDKSLRLLWKGEAALPWSSFRDCNEYERELMELAEKNLSDEERSVRSRITSAEFKAHLDREYTLEQKRSIVAILSAIGHGEAYAWLVSASLLPEVKSTGAKAALTMQILEEAKHFVVMRELMHAFGVEIPRQSVWEYLLLEGALKAKGFDRFFGMNVLVESIALSIFGLFSTMPGLEVLRLFHLDESRHTALPANYFKEFPLSRWQKKSPVARMRRLKMALPALPLIMLLEADLAVLGIDAFDFAGSVMRKVTHLSERAGFLQPEEAAVQTRIFNQAFNAYCKATRPSHRYKNFLSSETTTGAAELAVEREAFGDVAAHS